MVHAKVAKMKRKERKIFILNYLYFADFAKSLRSLRGIRLLIHPLFLRKSLFLLQYISVFHVFKSK